MKRRVNPVLRVMGIGVWIVSILLSLLSGCFARKPHNTDADVQAVLPGTPVRLIHRSSGGSMEYGTEFMIELTPEELVRTEYYPTNEYSPVILEKEHEPITAAQWADIVKILTDLYPVLDELPADGGNDDDANGAAFTLGEGFTPLSGWNVGIPASDDGFTALDGGDYWELAVTWQEENGEERTARYREPQDRRVSTLTSLLREIAEPIGREIVWYTAPVLNGIFLNNDNENYSFQFTPRSDAEDTVRFIARYNEGKERVDFSVNVPLSAWDSEKFTAMNLTAFPPGTRFSDPVTVTLYYDDGKQTTVQPDAETDRRRIIQLLHRAVGGV